MSDPLDADATAADIAAGVRTGAVSARAVVEAALARIEQGNRAINAFTAIAAARALERAKRIDTERRAGTPLGELAGVPFGVKAMIDVAGLTTTGGSALYRNAGAATRDAVVVRKLEGGRRGVRRCAQHGRVRDGRHDRERVLRTDAQSA